ncbi:hypothetical protein GJ496_003565 [Pomphorhynchus laevis]|nr:hypothetical protein GJ496_003565 [Pomphorhynchus laevis]
MVNLMKGNTLTISNKEYDLSEAVKWVTEQQCHDKLLVQLCDPDLFQEVYLLKTIFPNAVFSFETGCPDILGCAKLSQETHLICFTCRYACKDCSKGLMNINRIHFVFGQKQLSDVTIDQMISNLNELNLPMESVILIDPSLSNLKLLIANSIKNQIQLLRSEAVEALNFNDIHVFIGGENIPFILLFKNSPLYRCNPFCDNKFSAVNVDRQWTLRYSRVQWAKYAKRLVLISRTCAMSLPNDYLRLEKAIRDLSKFVGKQLIVIHSAKTSINALLNNFYHETDLYIVACCEVELSNLIDHKLNARVASIYELLIAFTELVHSTNGRNQWAVDNYIFNISELANLFENCRKFSQAKSNECLTIVPILDHLKELNALRTWKGMSITANKQQIPTVEQGRAGLPISYSHEPDV